MKSLSWNVRGLGSPRAVRRLRHLIKQQNPRMVFLMETKLDKKRMEMARKSCGLVNGIEIEAEWTRGGLCLAWKDDIEVTLKIFSKWHIDVLVKEDGIQEEWQFTGLYGSPYLRDQNLVWNLLRRLNQECNYPWLVAGDFNEIMYSFEKSGGLPRDQRRMEVFRDILEECQLMDIGYSGVWYTWERGNLPETNIRERLDRGVANGKWINLFPLGSIQHIPYSTPNHCPLLIMQIDSQEIEVFTLKPGRLWRNHLRRSLKEIWESSLKPLMDKLKNLQIGLTKWTNTLKGKKGELKKRLTKELETMLKEDRDDETFSKIIDTKIHLNMEIEKDEVYWEQRARVNWLQFGDRNTAYFHNCATARR
ncbi:reverse transcriptase [Gossypium australe]|uniref:Reverse transcriptase n=1 Tax=Gossypium australe TaxID=47621 RepID=A0A5B6X9Y8_9ROSI|nr:reverse transcriptase [Gossypium australe]